MGVDWLASSGESAVSNQPTLFTATALSSTSIRIAWVSSIGAVLPDGFLIAARKGAGSFPSVVDGTPVANDSDWTNNNAAQNVTYQFGSMSYDFESLSINTQYFFEIYAYRGAGGSINYLTTSVPAANATTLDDNPANFSNQVFWWRSDDLTEAAGEISNVNDRYNTNDLIAVGGRNTPNQIAAQLNGHPSIRFTSANNEILTEAGILGVTDMTFYILFKALSTSSTRILFTNVASNQGFNTLLDTNRIQATFRTGAASQLQQFNFSDVTTEHLLTLKFKSNGVGVSIAEMKLDGAERIRKTNLNSMQNSAGTIYLGSDLSNLSLDGHVYDVLLVNKFHTDAEENGMHSYINSRYAKAISPAVFNSFTFNSTLDAAVTNLFGRYIYELGFVSMPILDLDHSWSGNANDFTDATMQRFASYGLFTLAKGERGRNSAGGSRDVMRELYDHYEFIKYIVANFSSVVDVSRVIDVGYSGGGGQAVGKRVKFPYLYTMTVSHFGMTDYDEWYDESVAGRQTEISTSIGGTPPSDSYDARRSRSGASGSPGKLRIYHDTGDTEVQVHHSDDLKTELDADGFTNYVYTKTTVGSPTRAIHGLPNTADAGAPNINFEADWVTECFTLPTPVMPTSGTHEVRGFLVIATPSSFKFELWLGGSANPKSSASTNNEHGTLAWNHATNSYTLTILSVGTVHYQLIDDQGRTATGTATSATPVTFSAA